MKATKTLLEAQAQGFVVIRGERYEIANQFYRWCEESGHPYTRISPRTKYATVALDLIANHYQLNEQGLKRLAAAIDPNYIGEQPYGIAPVLTMLRRVPIDQAVSVARVLVGIAADPANRVDNKPAGGRPRIWA